MLLAIALTVSCNSRDRQSAEKNDDTSTAHRIVTLAPHLSELVFAAGAGDKLVGVSAFSDYPPEVSAVPVVSDAFTVDQEQLAMLQPDMLLAWASGTPAHVVDELRDAGYNVTSIRTRGIDEITRAILEIGELAGTGDLAGQVARDFDETLTTISDGYSNMPEISVFYQVSSRPLFTINGEHYISEIIGMCGGRNVFADLGDLAPGVTVEAVVERNPEVLLAGSADGRLPFEDWRRWEQLAANRYGNQFIVSADAIGRPSVRLVDAAEEVCHVLEVARLNR
ncbi:MAG: cobalamin-binding protein, partial [Woeseiaceae bacterium]